MMMSGNNFELKTRPYICTLCASPCEDACETMIKWEDAYNRLDIYTNGDLVDRVIRVMIKSEMDMLERIVAESDKFKYNKGI